MKAEWFIYLLGFAMGMSPYQVISQVTSETEMEFLDNLSGEAIDQLGDQTIILEQWQFLKAHPLNLNTLKSQDLEDLHILSPVEIRAIIEYRDEYGPIIHPLELQVIDALPLQKLRRLIPLVTVIEDSQSGGESEGYLLVRSHGYFPRRSGFLSDMDQPPAYQGSPLSFLIKYRQYQYHSYSWGGSLERDGGEEFTFRKRPGFDHIHFHYYKTGLPGKIKSIALGDYRISLGQGLLQYQGFAITKSSNPLMIKRVSPVLQPYSGTSEYFYFRGAAVEWELSPYIRNFIFLHYKKRDATVRTDSEDKPSHFSAFQTSGLHRSLVEIAKRNQVSETVVGHRIQWERGGWRFGLNSLYQRFSLPYRPVTRLDNINRLTGSRLLSHSLDFSGYFHSFHLFGEVATQNYHIPAFTITGLYSFTSRLDGGILIRRFPAYFAPFHGKAFSARSLPNNESGVYVGINYHFGPYSRLSFYLDSWNGLGPTFQASGPTFDQDLFLRYDISRRREWEAYAQFKFKHRADNDASSFPDYNEVIYKSQINLRIQFRKITYQMWRWTNRVELVRVEKAESLSEFGILGFTDLLWSPIGSWWSIAGRLACFDTDSYDTRIYTYEPDVRYSFSIPSFYGRGWRIVARISRKWRNGLRVELRSGLTILPGEEEVGSGHNAVRGELSQQIKLQAVYLF